jgi:hypothetical protein
LVLEAFSLGIKRPGSEADHSHLTTAKVYVLCFVVKYKDSFTFYILNVTLLNAHVLYQLQNEKDISFPDFQVSAITGLLEKHEDRRIPSKGGSCSSGDIPRCLTDHHFPFTCLALLVM